MSHKTPDPIAGDSVAEHGGTIMAGGDEEGTIGGVGEELELGEGAGVAGADYGDLTGGGHLGGGGGD